MKFQIFALLTLVAFSSGSFAESLYTMSVQTMSPKMLFIGAPVPNASSPANLELNADHPGDVILSNQKPSLTRISLSQAQVQKAYASQNLAMPTSYRVFANFIDGVHGKAPFETVGTTDSDLWLAVIPTEISVTDAILQLEWFSDGLGGHAQIRFKLGSPILLISQSDSSVTKTVDGDVTYALMALRTESGEKDFGAVNALTGSFASSYMVSTAKHLASVQMTTDDPSFVEQYALQLSASQKQNLFSYVLQNGTRAGEHEIYNLIYNSCIHAALRAIRTVDSRVDAWEFNPYQVVPQLQSLGLIASQLPSANDEFSAPIRTLSRPTNEKTIAMVDKFRGLMKTQTFEESIRLLAANIIQDRWTGAELTAVFKAASTLSAGANAAGLASLPSSLIASIKADPALAAKTEVTVQRLTSQIASVLQRNQIELPELLSYLSLAARP